MTILSLCGSNIYPSLFAERDFIKVLLSKYLPISSQSWEEDVAKLWTKVLQPMGFELWRGYPACVRATSMWSTIL